MLHSLKELKGYSIRATDGEIGQVQDFYFDDQEWIIRYVVVDTGDWLTGRRVLLSPAAFTQLDRTAQSLLVLLTKEQVENSPTITVDQPISRQQENELHAYYNWPPYWGMAGLFPLEAAGLYPLRAQEAADSEAVPAESTAGGESEGDFHLRSTNEVIGYYIQARDDDVGHIDDLLMDDETWTLQYMVVDTQNWLPGKKVLLALSWITTIDWTNSLAHVDLLKETIQDSPEYDPVATINRDYETQLHDYYNRPKYWLHD